MIGIFEKFRSRNRLRERVRASDVDVVVRAIEGGMFDEEAQVYQALCCESGAAREELADQHAAFFEEVIAERLGVDLRGELIGRPGSPSRANQRVVDAIEGRDEAIFDAGGGYADVDVDFCSYSDLETDDPEYFEPEPEPVRSRVRAQLFEIAARKLLAMGTGK